jgi:hypothetical protein
MTFSSPWSSSQGVFTAFSMFCLLHDLIHACHLFRLFGCPYIHVQKFLIRVPLLNWEQAILMF